MENAFIQVVVYLKENIKMVKKMDMEFIHFLMEIYMKENGKMMKEMD